MTTYKEPRSIVEWDNKKKFLVTYKSSLEPFESGTCDVLAFDISDAICQTLRKFPHLIVYSVDLL